jgi:hypothetical protein
MISVFGEVNTIIKIIIGVIMIAFMVATPESRFRIRIVEWICIQNWRSLGVAIFGTVGPNIYGSYDGESDEGILGM